MQQSALILVATLLCSTPSAALAAEGPVGTQSVVLTSGEFRIVSEPEGERVEMDGFGALMAPGMPTLPARTFLVLLPPGARVLSLNANGIGSAPVPGPRRVRPTPPMLPLSGSPELMEKTQREWDSNYREIYGSDQAYPAAVARITGSGSLRKYSYVAVSFCPFTYRALSGELIHHQAARVEIHYRLPSPGSEEETSVERLQWDTLADERARALFVNYEAMKETYRPRGAPPRDTAASHDYVIVTHADALQAVTDSEFVGWKTSLGYDVRTVLISDPEITAQPGRDLAEQIRNFLRASYGPWGIRYVLLVGKYETVPMRYCFADPTDHTHNPSNPGAAGGSVTTDHYYADLSLPDDESWDSDGDGFYGEFGQDDPDFLAEVSVGRIPTNAPAWITYALDKLVRFEQDTGPWKRQALHGGAVLFYENQNFTGIPFRDGAVCLDLIETESMNGWSVEHYSEQEGLCPSTYPWLPLSSTTFPSAWRNGQYGVVNWAGHGSPDGAWRVIWDWDDGDGVFETDGSDGVSYDAFIADWSTLDDDFPSIVSAVSCNVGYPEPNNQGRLAVDLLVNPSLGASAGVVSASRVAGVSADWPVTPGGAESICCEFNRHLIEGQSPGAGVGDALYDAKIYCHVNYGWDYFREYWNLYDYNLYGDPSLVWQGIGTTVSAGAFELPAPGSGPTVSPNPFLHGTRIEYGVARDGWVRASVFDVRGRRVAVLVDGYQAAGPQSMHWDGRGTGGGEIPAGVYFLRIADEQRTVSRRLVIVR